VNPFERIISWFATSEIPKGEQEKCADLITSHLSYIEKICEKVVLQRKYEPDYVDINGFSRIASPSETIPENAKDELVTAVMDHLKENDFKVVRDFRGDAKFTTYLATVISSICVNSGRRKDGRSRVRERAKKMDEVGQRIYMLRYEWKYSLNDIQNCLSINHGIEISIDQINNYLELMQGRGKKKFTFPGEEGYIIFSSEGSAGLQGELVVPCMGSNPEKIYAERESSALAVEVLSECLGTLNGEDFLILRMRLPVNDDEEPRTFREIAKFCAISEDKAERTVSRILHKFREIIVSKRLSLKDLI